MPFAIELSHPPSCQLPQDLSSAEINLGQEAAAQIDLVPIGLNPPPIRWKIAHLNDQEGDEDVDWNDDESDEELDLSDLSKATPAHFDRFQLALEKDAIHTLRNIGKFGFNKEQKFEYFTLALQQYAYKITDSVVDSIESSGFSKEERFELFKLALKADVYSTARDIKNFSCNHEERFELFRFALQQNVSRAVFAIEYFDFNEEERFELAKFAFQQDMAPTVFWLQKFELDVAHSREILSSDLSIESQAQQLILQANRDKDGNAPFCLILKAKNDPNLAFNTLAQLDELNEIRKTHKIALKIIDHANIRQEIAKTRQEIGKQIDLLILKGHGEPNLIVFEKTEGEEDKSYLCQAVSAADFEDVHPNGTVIVDSCSTGATNGLAQRISEVFNGTVFAPSEPSHNSTLYRIDGQLEPFYYEYLGTEITRKFKQGIEFTRCSAQLLSDLRLKEDGMRTAEESYLLGQDYRYKELLADKRRLRNIKTKIGLIASKYFDHARQLGHYRSRCLYFDGK